MNFADVFVDKFNLIIGTIVAVLSYLLGEHWVLFAAFLLFNVVDWITGWMKSRMAGVENSVKGFKGILKKLGYWIMIGVAFSMGVVFIEIGEVLGVNLKITTLLGWFVLASLTINELRSIAENFVEAGFNVPAIITNGLSVAEKILQDMDGTLEIDTSGEEKDIYRLDVNVPLEELKNKDTITLKINKDANLSSQE